MTDPKKSDGFGFVALFVGFFVILPLLSVAGVILYTFTAMVVGGVQ